MKNHAAAIVCFLMSFVGFVVVCFLLWRRANKPPADHNPDFEWPDPRLKIKYPCKECGSTDIKIPSEPFCTTSGWYVDKVFYPKCGKCGASYPERWKSETNAVTFWNQINQPISIYPVPEPSEFYDGKRAYWYQLESSKTWNRIAAARAWRDMKAVHPRLKPYDPPCYHLTLWERVLEWLMTL